MILNKLSKQQNNKLGIFVLIIIDALKHVKAQVVTCYQKFIVQTGIENTKITLMGGLNEIMIRSQDSFLR